MENRLFKAFFYASPQSATMSSKYLKYKNKKSKAKEGEIKEKGTVSFSEFHLYIRGSGTP